MAALGTITANAQKKTAIPWSTVQNGSQLMESDPLSGLPQPYAGAAPGTNYGTNVSAPTATPTTSPSTVTAALQNTTNTVDQAKAALNSNQPFIDNYLKPNSAGTTNFRQALTNTKASTTADAYDNAISQSRNRAQTMGFASNPQPVTFGAENSIAQARAKAISDIPNQVNIEAQPVEFQAAQLQQGQAPILNALAQTQQGETNTLETEKQAAALLAQQQAVQKAALTSGLAQTAISTAVPLIKQALAGTPAPPQAPYAGTPIAPGEPGFTGPVQTPSPQPGDPNFTGPTQNTDLNSGFSQTSAGLTAAGGGIGAALAGTGAAGAGATGAGLTSVSIPELGIFGSTGAGAGTAAGGAAAGEAGAAATEAGASTAAGGGLGSTLAALATNPVTWAVAGAIAAGIIWHKSQVHPQASEFVAKFQDPFVNDKGTGHLNQIVDQFDKAYASGQMTKQQAQAAYDETAKLIQGWQQDVNAYSQKGGHEAIVAKQAAATMQKYYGSNFEGILGKMAKEIAGMPGGA